LKGTENSSSILLTDVSLKLVTPFTVSPYMISVRTSCADNHSTDCEALFFVLALLILRSFLRGKHRVSCPTTSVGAGYKWKVAILLTRVAIMAKA